MALDYVPAQHQRTRARMGLPPLRPAGRLHPRWRLPVPRVRRGAATPLSHERMLHELAQLPAARQGPQLRPGRPVAAHPSMSRRREPSLPLMDRLLAGELQLRIIWLIAAATLVAILVAVLR